MTGEKIAREEVIKKSIELIGWIDTGERIKTKEDKQILEQLGKEYDEQIKVSQDTKLEKHHISF